MLGRIRRCTERTDDGTEYCFGARISLSKREMFILLTVSKSNFPIIEGCNFSVISYHFELYREVDYTRE